MNEDFILLSSDREYSQGLAFPDEMCSVSSNPGSTPDWICLFTARKYECSVKLKVASSMAVLFCI